MCILATIKNDPYIFSPQDKNCMISEIGLKSPLKLGQAECASLGLNPKPSACSIKATLL